MSEKNGNVWKPIAIVAIIVALLLMCLLAMVGCGTAAYLFAQRSGRWSAPQYEYGQEMPAPPEAAAVPFWLAGGATITYVEPGSPADDAGLQPGDVITAVDSQAVGEGTDLAEVIRSYDPGDTVTIEYRQSRTGSTDRVKVTLGEHPDDSSRPYLGIEYTMVPALGDGD